MHANVTRALTDSWVWTWHQILLHTRHCLPAHFHITISGHVHTHTRTEIVFRPFNSFPGQALPFCLFVFNFPLSILFIFRPSRHKKNTKIDAPLSLSCCWAGSQNQRLDSTHPCFCLASSGRFLSCSIVFERTKKMEIKLEGGRKLLLSGQDLHEYIFLIMGMLFVLRLHNSNNSVANFQRVVRFITARLLCCSSSNFQMELERDWRASKVDHLDMAVCRRIR
jgi:hypothetical protein